MRRYNIRGVTLVELMIVVAIIAILAALGSMAYGRYIKSGKIQRLTAMAQDMAQGQERYRSRNNTYFPANSNAVRINTTAADLTAFQNLLDFSQTIPADVTVETQSWTAGGNCTICNGVTPVTTAQGFAIRIIQDMNPGVAADTTVIYHNALPAPVILNEGD